MKILMFLLLIAGTTEHEARWENGNLKEKGELVDGKKHGRWRTWLKGGEPDSDGEYEKGVLHGTLKTFHKSNKIKTIEEYRKGKRHGRYAHFFENGRKKFDWTYSDGKVQDREQKAYYESGVVASVTHHLDRDGNSLYITYHQNGQRKSECKLVKGWPVGKKSQWYSNGKPHYVVHYNKKHKRHGMTKTWDRKGRVVREEIYENGKLVR